METYVFLLTENYVPPQNYFHEQVCVRGGKFDQMMSTAFIPDFLPLDKENGF